MGFIQGLMGCRADAITPLKPCEMAIAAE